MAAPPARRGVRRVPPLTSTRIRIAVTAGEPAGIGPDLCLALAQEDLSTELVIIGNRALLAERLQRLYGFTASEAHVAIGVASSASLEELAVERGTKIGTIRTQVKSALAKTGARKQAELATLVNRLRI